MKNKKPSVVVAIMPTKMGMSKERKKMKEEDMMDDMDVKAKGKKGGKRGC